MSHSKAGVRRRVSVTAQTHPRGSWGLTSDGEAGSRWGDSFTTRRNNLITTVSKSRQKGERSRQVEKFIWRGLELTCEVNIESST